VAIADLMSKLDLTHGGFYKHFHSKEQLLREAIANAFAEQDSKFNEVMRSARPGSELKALIEHYLSLEHCAGPADGCPMAALASEVQRFPRGVRLEIDKALKRRVKSTAKFLPGRTEEERERNCMALLAGMIGTVNVARALVDQGARQRVLEAAKDFYVNSFCR